MDRLKQVEELKLRLGNLTLDYYSKDGNFAENKPNNIITTSIDRMIRVIDYLEVDDSDVKRFKSDEDKEVELLRAKTNYIKILKLTDDKKNQISDLKVKLDSVFERSDVKRRGDANIILEEIVKVIIG